MTNEIDRVESTEIVTSKGEVIVLDNPRDSAQWKITADLMRTLSATRSEVQDAVYENGQSNEVKERSLPFPLAEENFNVSSLGHLPLPKYILQVRARRAATKKHQPPKVA